MLKLIPEGCNFQAIPKDSPYYVKGMISHVYRRLDRNKPATTIIAAGGGGTWGYHYEEPRPLTNRERARLFGYPDNFKFMGNIASVRQQIGNSVCPDAIKVIANVNNTEFPVDYSLLEDSSIKRDKGDFNTIIIEDKKYDLKPGYRISLKSTNGNYLAISQHELQWEGEIFVLVKLHIKEIFLYKAIKAGLQLASLDLNESLGWLEIRGIISKNEFQKGYLSKQLPDKT